MREGVGGSCDTSLSDGGKSGDMLSSEGGGEHGGVAEGERDWFPEVSRRGRKANLGF